MSLNDDNECPLPFAVGDYAMHLMHGQGDGTLIRVDAISDIGTRGPVCWIHYVAGKGEYGGGSSGCWPIANLRPVTDPSLKAQARVYEAHRQISAAKAVIEKAERDLAKWRGVIEVLENV